MPSQRQKSTPRTLDPALRKAQILDAARSLLVEKGYGELLLDDVAKRAGVAKGTLYLHFADKREIYSAVMEGILDDLEQRVRDAAGAVQDPGERLERVVERVLGYIDDHKDFFLIAGPVSPQVRTPGMTQRFESYISALGEVLQAGIDAGRLRPVDLRTGAMMVIAFSRMFMMRKVFCGRSESLQSCAKEMMDLMLNGLGAEGRP